MCHEIMVDLDALTHASSDADPSMHMYEARLVSFFFLI